MSEESHIYEYDCRTPDGITIQAVHSIIFAARILAQRLRHRDPDLDDTGISAPVWEALCDMQNDEDLGYIIGLSSEKLEKLSERVRLIRNHKRTTEEDDRLKHLDEWAQSIPPIGNPENKFSDLMMEFARDFGRDIVSDGAQRPATP